MNKEDYTKKLNDETKELVEGIETGDQCNYEDIDLDAEECERIKERLIHIKMSNTLENIAKSLEIIAKKIQEQ